MEGSSADFAARLKKAFTMKKAIKLLTIVGGLLLIVFMTVANVTLDPSKTSWTTWATNALIMVGIMVFGLVMGESVGTDKQTERKGGLYQTNMGLFYQAKEAVSDIAIYFSQFFLWYKDHERYDKRLDYLMENGFEYAWAKAIVDCLGVDDVERLTKESILFEKNGKKIIIKRIGEDKAEAVRKVLDGSIAIDSPSYSYYLSANAHDNKKYTLEQAKEITKSIRLNKGVNRVLKIGTSLFVSALWAMVTVNDFMDGESAQAWLNLISRITSFVTSFSSGWATSVVNVRLEALRLENKASVLKAFRSCVDKKEFVPKSYEEEAKALWEEEEKEREEARASVIDPEIIKPNETILIEQKKDEKNI